MVVWCKECNSKLQITKKDLNRKNMVFNPPKIGGYEFKCPVCKKVNYTTFEQEKSLEVQIK